MMPVGINSLNTQPLQIIQNKLLLQAAVGQVTINRTVSD